MVVGDEYAKTVARLMEMGFSKEDVTRAMKAAFNNADRATEFLLNVFASFNII